MHETYTKICILSCLYLKKFFWALAVVELELEVFMPMIKKRYLCRCASLAPMLGGDSSNPGIVSEMSRRRTMVPNKIDHHGEYNEVCLELMV